MRLARAVSAAANASAFAGRSNHTMLRSRPNRGVISHPAAPPKSAPPFDEADATPANTSIVVP
jgi:hypothetical protein